MGNLLILWVCHRLVHEGGFGLRVTDDGLFVFSKPDGTRLAETGRLDRHRDRLDALNREQDLEIDERTAWSRWIGDPMVYGWATEILCSDDNLLGTRRQKLNRL